MSTTISPPLLVLILGPTGAGKTQLALHLAAQTGAEIISADSMQVYCHMDIGTAKPSREERERVPHHLIDVVNPDEPFSVSSYLERAEDILATSVRREKIFIVVGGTGLYVKALLGGLFQGPGADPELRAFYHEQLQRYGRLQLHETLRAKDPLAAEQIDFHNPSRVIRALEVWDQCGKSIVEMQRDHNFQSRGYRYHKIGLKIEREKLYERIEKRMNAMMSCGFLEEVEILLASGYHEDLKSMQSLGYRHLVNYLAGRCSLDEALDTMCRDTKKYAKRQETWFKKDHEISWHDAGDLPAVLKDLDQFLASIEAP